MSPYGPALRSASADGFLSGCRFRLGLAALILLVLPAAADAYTLVLRSGRRVTIPDDFRVTQAAVNYEASPGFSVTVWLSNVDIAATESANAEPAGSFAGRIKSQQGAAGPTQARAAGAQAGRHSGPKSVTNSELEPLRLRREAQEQEYERTRRRRGMPSKREHQERVEGQDRRLREWARQMEVERLEAEVEALRDELAGVRRRLDSPSPDAQQRPEPYGYPYASPDVYPYVYAPPAQFVTVLPYGRRGGFWRGGFGFQPRAGRGPHNPLWGQPSAPAHVGPGRNVWARPWALPPAAGAQWRSR